ncbi:type II toxin-antitoxin system HicB family antitoxin, partial [bacterium]|nr:type II toxin-antitoxin system HicB family antitoxin [bacterium]MBU3955424.1 type II toxin-antitoxin system HicB family antitoxin [bacterium]
KEGKWYVALCPEVDIASQGETIEEASENLKEAVKLYFQTASKEEIEEVVSPTMPPLVSTFEVAVT